jgi:uncharacterized protein YegL
MNVYFLIDRSGSMSPRWDETLGAVNAYMKSLAAEKAAKKAKATATVAVFDAGNGIQFDVLRSGIPVADWRDLTSSDAQPRGMTPLFDAIGKMVAMVDADKPKKAVVAVVTDGAENASREVTREAAKSMFDRLRAQGFQVVFLGADFDAFGQAHGVGTQTGQTISMTAGNYESATRSLASHTAAYAATGAAMSWSDEDRKRAAGRK